MLSWLLLTIPGAVTQWIGDRLWPYRGLRADVKVAKASIQYWPAPPP